MRREKVFRFRAEGDSVREGLPQRCQHGRTLFSLLLNILIRVRKLLPEISNLLIAIPSFFGAVLLRVQGSERELRFHERKCANQFLIGRKGRRQLLRSSQYFL